MAETSTFLQVEGVSKAFDGEPAVAGFDLRVKAGEFVSLLGPSGCGKTTLLRIVAGLEVPDSGRVLLDGHDITDMPPHKRPVNMVFQRITLFPHLDVFENVAFGLRLAKVSKTEIHQRVTQTLELVRLPGFAKRAVRTLSGGQAQRVALARAIANRPKLLLFDEPLSALDLQIRRDMQAELKAIHKTLGGTFLYVTHDQEEAMSMSDRVVVMDRGRIVQADDPVDLYRSPNSRFVASFLGSSNLWPGKVTGSDAAQSVVEADGRTLWAAPASAQVGQPVWLLLREESIAIVAEPGDSGTGPTSMTGVITDVSFVGPVVHYTIEQPERKLKVARPSHGERVLSEGTRVRISWKPQDLLVLAGEDNPAEASAAPAPDSTRNGDQS